MAELPANEGQGKIDALPQTTGEVPVFSLIVYVAHRDSKTEARTANIDGFSCRAADERSALQQLLPQVKQHVLECLTRKEPIEWLDPPLERASDEQQRVIPFHL